MLDNIRNDREFPYSTYESFAICTPNCDPFTIYRSNVKRRDPSISAGIQVRTIPHTPYQQKLRPVRPFSRPIQRSLRPLHFVTTRVDSSGLAVLNFARRSAASGSRATFQSASHACRIPGWPAIRHSKSARRAGLIKWSNSRWVSVRLHSARCDQTHRNGLTTLFMSCRTGASLIVESMIEF